MHSKKVSQVTKVYGSRVACCAADAEFGVWPLIPKPCKCRSEKHCPILNESGPYALEKGPRKGAGVWICEETADEFTLIFHMCTTIFQGPC